MSPDVPSATRRKRSGVSADPVVSAEGRYVAFSSTAFNLIANDVNGAIRVDVSQCDG